MRLILGCGYLGLRVAKLWLERGIAVAAVTRSEERAEQWKAMGIRPIIADVTDRQSLQSLKAQGPFEGIFHAVGLDRKSGRSMEEVYIGGLANVLAVVKDHVTGPFLFVSSSSVYAHEDGGWVDETTVPNATSGSGKIVLDAENTLRAARPDAVILRFAGIYGPERLLRGPAIAKGEPIPVDPDKWLNLIHVDDGARLVDLAWEYSQEGSKSHAGNGSGDLHHVFHGSDQTPVLRGDYYRNLARLMGAPEPSFVPGTPGQRGGPDGAHRRISSLWTQQTLGWKPVYSDHVLGLRAILAEESRAASS